MQVRSRRPGGIRTYRRRAERARCTLKLPHVQCGIGVVNVREGRHPAQAGNDLAQELEPLAGGIGCLARQARDVAARARQARNNSTSNRIARGREHDRYHRSCLLRGENGRGVVSENDIHLEADELRCNLSKPFASSLSPPILNGDIAPFGPAQFIQPLHEDGSPLGLGRSRTRAKNANCRQLRRLLRACRQGPRDRAAKERDERAAVHSMTSSATESSVGGILRPSSLAVSALMTNSNLVARATGRSAGLAPLTMRPV